MQPQQLQYTFSLNSNHAGDNIYRHIFTPLPCSCEDELKKMGVLVNTKRRDIIYQCGDKSRYVYLITGGLIMLSSLFKEGRELGQIILTAGSLFGEQEVINQTARVCRASSLTNCQIWKFSQSDFNQLRLASTEFSLYLTKVMSMRLQRSELRLGYFSSHDVPQRLAQLLLELLQMAGIEDESGYYLTPCPTQGELANLIITSRETISVVMGEFRRQGLVSFDRRRLYILNKSALNNM